MKKVIVIVLVLAIVFFGGFGVFVANKAKAEAGQIQEILEAYLEVGEMSEESPKTQYQAMIELSQSAMQSLSQLQNLNLKYTDKENVEIAQEFLSNFAECEGEVVFLMAMEQLRTRLTLENKTVEMTKTQMQEMLKEIADATKVTSGYSLNPDFNSYTGSNSALTVFQNRLEQASSDTSDGMSAQIDQSDFYQYLQTFPQALTSSINARISTRNELTTRLNTAQNALFANPLKTLSRNRSQEESAGQTQMQSQYNTQNGNQNAVTNDGDEAVQSSGNAQSQNGNSNSKATSASDATNGTNSQGETETNVNSGDTQNTQQEQNQNGQSSICGDGACGNGESRSTCSEDCN